MLLVALATFVFYVHSNNYIITRCLGTSLPDAAKHVRVWQKQRSDEFLEGITLIRAQLSKSDADAFLDKIGAAAGLDIFVPDGSLNWRHNCRPPVWWDSPPHSEQTNVRGHIRGPAMTFHSCHKYRETVPGSRGNDIAQPNCSRSASVG